MKYNELKSNFVARLARPRSFNRFALVGIINTMMGVGLFPLMHWIAGDVISVNSLLILSYVICTASAFILHKIITFESRGSLRAEAMKYIVLSSATYLINAALLNAVIDYSHFSAVYAQVVISTILSAALMLANYLGMNYLVFGKPKEEEK